MRVRERGCHASVLATRAHTNFAAAGTAATAPDVSSVVQAPQGEYLTLFGLYLITEASLFDYLEEQQVARAHIGSTAGPLHLTPALDKIRAEAGLEGILLEGERFDIGGDPHTYLSTLSALAPAPLASAPPSAQAPLS